MKENTNIILIGMPGCGKSSLGYALAKRIAWCFVDVDQLVEERAGMPIPQIFETRGEAVFRSLESQVIKELCGRQGLVIATGGGAVKDPQNLKNLRRNGMVVYIDCPVEQLNVRGGRPLAQNQQQLRELYAQRVQLYRDAADCTVPYSVNFEVNVRRVWQVWRATVPQGA